MEKVLSNITKVINLPVWEKWLSLFGLTVLSWQTLCLGSFVYRHFIRPRRNLLKRYGEGSWVVVTGGTDGVGKAFCLEFARLGFNIVNISRNLQKLETTANDIKAVNPNVQVKSVKADFKDSFQPGFYDNIFEQIKDLDISVLINNIGITGDDYFLKFDDKFLVEYYGINCVSQVMMTHKLLPKLLARKNKGAIINLSSLSASRPHGFLMPYAPTKAFNDFFSRAIEQEYGDKLDIVSCIPGFMRTSMIGHGNLPGSIPVESFIKGLIDKLGYETRTPGTWFHEYFYHSLMARTEDYHASMNRKNLPRFLDMTIEARKKNNLTQPDATVTKTSPGEN